MALKPRTQGRNVGLKSGGTNSGEDNVAFLGTYRQFDFLVYGANMVGSGKQAVPRPEGPRAGVCSWRGGN